MKVKIAGLEEVFERNCHLCKDEIMTCNFCKTKVIDLARHKCFFGLIETKGTIARIGKPFRTKYEFVCPCGKRMVFIK